MSKITISNLQTEENLSIELQAIEAHNVVGGSDKEGKKESGYGKEYGGEKEKEKGGEKEEGKYNYGAKYYAPVYHPPTYPCYY
jgi:hypothetical protein